MPNGTPECPPVWQYILIMGQELIGLAKGAKLIGSFHTAKELESLAKIADKAVEDIREELEKLTGWHP